jgi:hypothetical protein
VPTSVPSHNSNPNYHTKPALPPTTPVITSGATIISGATTEAELSKLENSLADQLYKLKLFVGTGTNGDGTPIFDLDKPVTRMQGLAVLLRLLGDETEAAAYTGPSPFVDTPEWGANMAAYAYSKGITAGVDSTHFDPDSNMSYQQFTAFLLRALGYSEKNGDFIYANSLDKAVLINLYTQNERTRLQNGSYQRGSMVINMTDALLCEVKGSQTTLIDQLRQEKVVDEQAAQTYKTDVSRIYGR